MKNTFNSLRVLGTGLALCGWIVGLIAAWAWVRSDALWQAHLTRADHAGQGLYANLAHGAPLPKGLGVSPLDAAGQDLATRGEFARIDPVLRPAFVTNVPIRQEAAPGFSGPELTLAVVSRDLTYPLARVSGSGDNAAAETLGALARVLASFCSDPVLYARMDNRPWIRIDGAAVWGCEAAPADYRLLAVLLALVGIGITATVWLNTAGHFSDFAERLRARRRLGGPDSYDTDGPQELREIVAAVNSYLQHERAQLEKRATVLSGVSHDLGTPATRLRLRAALIEDAELREKLEADIDQMTDMIESVLTYTRSEINAESPRAISLTSLVEATVSDYQDLGSPVRFHLSNPGVVRAGQSVFTAKRGRRALPEGRPVLVTARPVSLRRALSNLIDNALKYGRKATVTLEVDANRATLVVEDGGSGLSVSDVEAVVAPFKRGANTQRVKGFGLGLTIVATVAEQHGGRLYFEGGTTGLRACLEISRS